MSGKVTGLGGGNDGLGAGPSTGSGRTDKSGARAGPGGLEGAAAEVED